jgi:hypothetical protein
MTDLSSALASARALETPRAGTVGTGRRRRQRCRCAPTSLAVPPCFRHSYESMTKPRTRKCRACGSRFAPVGRGRPPTYCSSRCRQRAYSSRLRRRRRRSAPQALLDADLHEMRLRTIVPRLVAVALIDFGIVLDAERQALVDRLALEAAYEAPLARKPRRRRQAS